MRFLTGILVLLIFLSFLSCEKEDERYERLIVGEWRSVWGFRIIGMGENDTTGVVYVFDGSELTKFQSESVGGCSKSDSIISGPKPYSIKNSTLYYDDRSYMIHSISRHRFVFETGNLTKTLKRCN